MNKKLTKAHKKNIRLDSPLGLLGVPPDAPKGAVIVTDSPIIIVMSGRVTISAEKDYCSIPQ